MAAEGTPGLPFLSPEQRENVTGLGRALAGGDSGNGKGTNLLAKAFEQSDKKREELQEFGRDNNFFGHTKVSSLRKDVVKNNPTKGV